VYPVWGRQVLHASAVVRSADGSVLAFAGPTGAGKSTLAYALAMRPGWTQLSDDTLAFACEGDDLVLHPLQNDARLRPATAAHFGRAANPVVPVPWPAFPLHLRTVMFVESGTGLAEPVAIARLPAAEAYRRLLEQAHAFTLEIADHNRRLMRDYLALTAAVPAFVLSCERSFGAIELVLDAIERHASAELRTPPAPRT
jgi:DNA polymerase III delta prime subunit